MENKMKAIIEKRKRGSEQLESTQQTTTVEIKNIVTKKIKLAVERETSNSKTQQ